MSPSMLNTPSVTIIRVRAEALSRSVAKVSTVQGGKSAELVDPNIAVLVSMIEHDVAHHSSLLLIKSGQALC